MSEKKMFTAEEVARMILEKAHNTLKKHEEMLQKSKNTAHEIDAGEEPNNDEAECPDSLKGEGSSSASKSESKKENSPVAESEDSEMEDQPLSDSDSEEDESEESEDDEDKFEFKKSESGMHVIQYKTLKKARVDEGKSNKEKVADRKERNKIHDDALKMYHSKDYKKRREQGPKRRHEKGVDGYGLLSSNPHMPADQKSRTWRKQHESNMKELKDINPNLPKSEDCEYEVKKSESGMHTVQYKTLKKFGSQGAPLGSNLGSSIAAGIKGNTASSTPSSASKPYLSKEEGMIPNPDPKAPTHIKRQGEKEGKSRPLTDAQRKAGFGQSISSERKTSNIGQYEGIKAAREKKEKESKEPEGMDKSYEEKIKEGKGTEVFHSKKGKARTISGQERDSVTVKRGTANLKDQTDNNRRNREEKGQARKEHGETGKLHPTYLELGKDRRKKQGTIHNRQKDSIKFRKKNRGELEKERNAPRKRSTDE